MTSTISVHSPVDQRVLGQVDDSDSAAVGRVAQRLRLHQTEWEALSPKARARWLRTFRDWMLDEADVLADTLGAETGKPRAEAVLEVPLVAEMISYYADNAPAFLNDHRVAPSGLLSATKRLTTRYRPYPLVGVISPWNFPILIPGVDSITALLAGAAVLLKPSEVTPLSALALSRGWQEIGAPGVFEVITGGAGTGSAVVDEADYVQFTGSAGTGQAIAHRCVDGMVPYSLELGGKDPAIVLADADLKRAVAGIAWGALFNSGQACVAIERVYVEEPVYDEFVERLTELVGSLRQGASEDGSGFDVGVMATPDQLEVVRAQVDDAVASGAKALTGGGASGSHFEPTVLVNVDHTMQVMRDESFGPIIPVVKVRDADEAVSLANNSDYGLSATVWTRDLLRGEEIARRLEVGAVNINDVVCNLLSGSLPQGGWKHSGSGSRLGGADGVRKYTRRQAITSPRLPTLAAEPLWFPYGLLKVRVLTGVLHAVAGRDLRRRLRF